MDRRRLDTVAVHGPSVAPRAEHAVTSPVVLSSTFTFGSTAELCAFFEGKGDREEYGRYGNPSVRSCERVLAALDGAEAAALFASGMAAITTTLLTLLKPGDHVILTSDCYRRTRQFVTGTLARFGVAATLVGPRDLAGLSAAIVPGKTRAILTELPSNPFLRVPELDRFAEIARGVRGLKLIVDATFATPINLRPLELGAHLVIHSCTKYVAGHNDVLAGSVAGDAALVDAVREQRGVLGGVADAHAAYLVERGAKTLALRVRAQNETGLALARFLAAHPRVTAVHYPALESHPDHDVARRLLSGFGGVVSFELDADLAGTSRFIDACRVAQLAPSLGGVETLIEQPALMSHYELSREERLALGIPESLVRLAAGIEAREDLEADLAQALERL